MAIDDLAPGTTLGQYRIEGLIAVGGMASVYQGHHVALDRTIAIKVLPARYVSDALFVERFRQEARLVARLRHPNIMEVYDFGDGPGGLLYIVVEYMGGGTLASHLGTPMRPEVAGRIVNQMAAGLDYAHSRGIIHRDLKPGNILFTGDGDAAIGDFGLAKILEGTGGLTQAGTVLGTPEYMSPEQALGRDLDKRTDVYSLGVLLYTMLTGAVPYHRGSPLATMVAHVHESLPPPRHRNPDISEAVEQVIQKAMAKTPEDRYATAGEMAAALAAAIPGAARALPDSGAYAAAPTQQISHEAAVAVAAERNQPAMAATPTLARAGQPVPLAVPLTSTSSAQAGASGLWGIGKRHLLAGGVATIAVVLVALAAMMAIRQGASGSGTAVSPAVVAPAVLAPSVVAATPMATIGGANIAAPAEAAATSEAASALSDAVQAVAETEPEPAAVPAAEAPAPGVEAASAAPPAEVVPQSAPAVQPPAVQPLAPQPPAAQQQAPTRVPQAPAPLPPAAPPAAEAPAPAGPAVAPVGSEPAAPRAPAGVPVAPMGAPQDPQQPVAPMVAPSGNPPRPAAPAGGATVMPMGAP